MSPARAWNAFWFGPISARPLGAFRIAFGLVVLANLALMAPGLDVWLTDAGPFSSRAARELAGSTLRFSPLHYVGNSALVRAFYLGVLVVAVLFTLGWRTRLMGLLLYAGLLSIHHRDFPWTTGCDRLIIILAFLAMLAPAGAAYSLDALRESRRRGTDAEPIIVPWAQRLIQLQISYIYFLNGVLKASGKTWVNGTALYYVMNHAEYRRYHLGLRDLPLAINAMTYAALFVEFALAFLLWVRPARPYVIFAGVALHLGIIFTVNVPLFGEVMIATYLTFLDPDQLDALLRLLDPRRWIGNSRPMPAGSPPG